MQKTGKGKVEVTASAEKQEPLSKELLEMDLNKIREFM